MRIYRPFFYLVSFMFSFIAGDFCVKEGVFVILYKICDLRLLCHGILKVNQ